MQKAAFCILLAYLLFTETSKGHDLLWHYNLGLLGIKMFNIVKKCFCVMRILIIMHLYVFILAPVHFLSMLKFSIIYSWPLTALKKHRLGIIAFLAIRGAKAEMPWEASQDFINEIHIHIRIKHLKLLGLLILVLFGGSVFKITWRLLI